MKLFQFNPGKTCQLRVFTYRPPLKDQGSAGGGFQHSEDVLHSAQVRVRDLGPGKRRTFPARAEHVRQPLSPVHALSGWAQTVACSHWQPSVVS